MTKKEHIYVTAPGSKVRHPVNNFDNREENMLKSLLCREKPIWVRRCNEQELVELRICWSCNSIINSNKMYEQLMRET